MTHKIQTFLIALMASLSLAMAAQDVPNSNPNQSTIDLTQIQMPKPGVPVIEPTAEYDHDTHMLTIYCDPTRFYDYTLTLSNHNHETDFVVTSAIYSVSLSSMTGVVGIGLDSYECGTYVGAVNLSANGNSY